jgi:class 3 adenylate cyclase/tetratricopeptide (TPR) repeat protein
MPSPSSPTLEQFEGERRIVTALFAHLEGVAIKDEQMDIEVWAEVVNQALRLMESEVHRLGGEVGRLRQDGLMALFGAAAAHEDDPERAVLASLAMQRAIQDYAADLVRREGIELRLRVGVNTGEAVVTSIGDSRQQRVDSAMGEAVSLASRIEIAAQPGAVLVGENTYRLVRSLFEWEALGEIAVKGVSQPVVVYRPLARKPGAGKPRGIAGLESPLVGRVAEFRALQSAIERLRAGIGGIVTLVGEAGIGKSRLVAEIRKHLHCTQAHVWANEPIPNPQHPLSDVQWVEGRCLSYATTVTYQLWVDALRGLLGVAPDAGRDALREQVQALCGERSDDVYPYLGRVMSMPLEEEVEAGLRGLDAESLRFLTFRAVETLVERAVGRRALILVCEDLHWADPISLALLEHLLPLTDCAPLLFACIFRPVTEHGCWRIRESTARDYRHRHTDLWLAPLTEQESVELVGNLLHIEDLPEALKERILGHTEGNPFYVEEILRSLIDSDIIVHDETTGRWHTTQDVTDIPIPDTLRGVLMARSDRLPEAARRLLQLASVVGRLFSRHMLESISQRNRRLDDDLVTLQRAQMIRQRARLLEAEYVFKHQLTQEAAYDSLLRRKRRDLHRRVAEALERVFPERIDEQLGLLAHHWERARVAEKAIDYLRRAGEQAAVHFANVEAVEYFSRALDLTSEEDLVGRYALTSAREAVYAVQGMREDQRQDLAALAEIAGALAQRDGGPEAARRRAEVALREANYGKATADFLAAVDAAQRAVHLAQATGDVGLEAEGYLHWGYAVVMSSDRREGQLLLEKALALARWAGRRTLEADILRELGTSFVVQEEYDQAKECYERALRIWREIGNRRGEGRALSGLLGVAFFTTAWSKARLYAEESLRLCRLVGNHREEGYILGTLGVMSYAQGDYATSKRYCEQGLRCFREVEDRQGEGFNLAGQGRIAHEMGDDRAALDFGQQALDIGETIESALVQARALVSLGHALAGLGCLAEARDAYQRAVSLGMREGMNARAGLARVLLSEGDLIQAQAYVEEILEAAQSNPAFDGTWEPFRIYLTCYHVLRASDDPRAQEVLSTAHRLLQESAHEIEDAGLRRSYLENVSAHREIVSEFSKRDRD